MAKRSDLEPEIIAEWSRRPGGQKRAGDILEFYGWLKQNRPDLLRFKASGDKYQVLKTILRNHIEP